MPLFTAYGTEQLILTSPDGVTWTQKYKVPATADGSDTFGNIDWDGNQVFVAQSLFTGIVGQPTHPGTIVTSTDGGNTWTNRTLSGSPQLGNGFPHGAVWASALGIWCAVGFDLGTNKAISVTSPDAITWTVHNFSAETDLVSIATNSTGSILVAITGVNATTSNIYSSVDGINWTLRKSLAGIEYNSLAYNGSYFMAGRGSVVVNGTAQNATSPDGITWTEGVSGQGATITSFGTAANPLTRHVLYDSTLALWVVPSVYSQDALSSGIFTSPDGLVWTKRYTASTDGSAAVTGIIRAGAKLYAMLNSSTTHFLSSVDAITWTPVTTTLADPSFMLEFTGSNFLTYSVPAAGDNFVRSSPDGNNWTNRYDDAALDVVWIEAFQVSTPPPTPTPTRKPINSQGPSRGIVLNLDRQVFEPLQSFSEIIWSITQEQNAQGARWLDLPNPWPTYGATWNSFPSKNQRAIMLGTQGANGVTWQDLPNPWSTYNVPWNSFPGGGQVEIFSANSPNDHGVAIPYFYVPALFFGNDRQTVLLDSWDFYFLASQNFELATVEFSGLTMPKAAAIPITDSLVDLSDDRTYAIAKALPTQSKYNRYVKLRLSGSSFYRAFRFGGGTVFLYSQERPSA